MQRAELSLSLHDDFRRFSSSFSLLFRLWDPIGMLEDFTSRNLFYFQQPTSWNRLVKKRKIASESLSSNHQRAPFSMSEGFTFAHGAAVVTIMRNDCPFKFLYLHFSSDYNLKLPSSDSNLRWLIFLCHLRWLNMETLKVLEWTHNFMTFFNGQLFVVFGRLLACLLCALSGLKSMPESDRSRKVFYWVCNSPDVIQ